MIEVLRRGPRARRVGQRRSDRGQDVFEAGHDRLRSRVGAPPPPRALADAVASVAAAVERFRTHAGPLAPHPVYGRCSAADYERLHAIHVADHLRAVRGA